MWAHISVIKWYYMDTRNAKFQISRLVFEMKVNATNALQQHIGKLADGIPEFQFRHSERRRGLQLSNQRRPPTESEFAAPENVFKIALKIKCIILIRFACILSSRL